ncbi:hypothetical protein B4N89_46135 [Embleya scabrispora]|uniref:Uncharacterized protein n=1 Tax=Embleya scabrispora TaxID=159449 RepID=A0A1T3NJ55_9ACTN|nr:hypothetical protein B4N89_46135 [Embleya scabrispora]
MRRSGGENGPPGSHRSDGCRQPPPGRFARAPIPCPARRTASYHRRLPHRAGSAPDATPRRGYRRPDRPNVLRRAAPGASPSGGRTSETEAGRCPTWPTRIARQAEAAPARASPHDGHRVRATGPAPVPRERRMLYVVAAATAASWESGRVRARTPRNAERPRATCAAPTGPGLPQYTPPWHTKTPTSSTRSGSRYKVPDPIATVRRRYGPTVSPQGFDATRLRVDDEDHLRKAVIGCYQPAGRCRPQPRPCRRACA